MILNYKYEIFPNEEQSNRLHQWVNICRHQYNSALLDKQNYYQEHKKSISRFQLQKQLVKDKQNYPYLKEVPSQPLQEVFLRLEKSFKKFFHGESNYPKIKKYRDYSSITFTQFGIGVQKVKNKKSGKVKHQFVRRAASFGEGGNLLISGLGLIYINLHRKVEGKVKQVIIKRQGNHWFAIFSVEKHVDQTIHPQTHKTTGVDVGIQKFAVLSNGTEIKNPTFLRKEERKLKRQQQKLSRMKKGSNNWKKQVQKVQNIHGKVANQRRDFLHKQSYRISKCYSVVCVENLNIKNLVKNRKLAKSIHDAGWGMFRTFLTYKCENNGGILVKVNPAYTTQDCFLCGNRVKKSLSVRTHFCEKCGCKMDRDHNSALNIERAGLSQIGYKPAQ
jgi:putative transposase